MSNKYRRIDMSVLFEDRITPAGKQAIQDAIDYVASELKGAIQAHGEASPEAARLLLALVSIDQIAEPREGAHAAVERHLAISEKIYGPDSVETANSYLLLGWSHGGLDRDEEAGLATNQAFSLPEGKRDFPPVEPMLEALCWLLDKLQDNPRPDIIRLPLVLAVLTLGWLVTYCLRQSPAYPVFLERLRPSFESWGFRDDLWEWLLRRCNRLNNDTVGLISVLLDERLIASRQDEPSDSEERDNGDSSFVRAYEISGIKPEHWTSPEGFSGTFPVSVADGELSLRVERLLAEGCRCLNATSELNTVFLIFSDNFVGRRISAFGTAGSLDEERTLFQGHVKDVIAELGADSAMMIDWVELHRKQTPEADGETTEAVMVFARDAKSYLMGLQPARWVDGKYVFDEPVVRVAEDNWFSEFTFPVQPVPSQHEEDQSRPCK
jgi:hypothetical protein